MNNPKPGSQPGAAQAGELLYKGWWLASNALLVVMGYILSLYGAWHHWLFKQHGKTDLACNINAQVSCDAVAGSPYSEIAGIPLPDIGCAFYLGLAVLLGLLWLGFGKRRQWLAAYVVLLIAAVVVTLVLAGISLIVLQRYCLVCLGIYGINLALVIFGIKEFAMLRRSFAVHAALAGLSKIVLVMAVALTGCQMIKNRETTPPRKEVEVQKPPQDPSLVTPEFEGLLAPAAQEIPLTTTSFDEQGEDYRLGDDHKARVTITVFSDFQCPACASMATLLHQVKDEFGDDLRLVFRNYPLDQACNSAMQQPLHRSACKVAYLARCAGQHEKFWQFHDLAFKNYQQAAMEAETWAKSLGLGDEEIAACLTSPTIKGKVLDDVALGNKLEVDSTPTLFINNRKYIGMREALAGTIRSLLNAQ